MSQLEDPTSGVDCDDGLDPCERLAQGFFDAEAEGCELCGAVSTGPLQRDAYGSVPIDGQELDVASICDQRRTNLVEPGFYDFT
jgi:hypothetical protein